MVSDYFMLRLMCLLWSPTLCAWNPYFLRIHLLSLYRAHLWLLWCRLLVRFRGWCGKKQGDVRGRRHILREELKLLKIAGVCHHPKTNWQGSGRSRALGSAFIPAAVDFRVSEAWLSHPGNFQIRGGVEVPCGLHAILCRRDVKRLSIHAKESDSAHPHEA